MAETHTLHKHSYAHHLRKRREIIESFEAKANQNRTTAERLADFMTSMFGSMTFLILNMTLFFLWIIAHSGWIPGMTPFDPFPFNFLTMMVSLEAIFLAIVVLISQNRSAKIDDMRDEISLQLDTIAAHEMHKLMELQVLLLKKNGVDISKDEEIQKMLEPIDTSKIINELEKQL